MRKHSFILLLIAPLLLFALLIQMGASRAAQAAPQGQAAGTAQTGEPVVEEVAETLAQPLLIRIRQTVPITYALALLQPFTDTALLTWPVTIPVTFPVEAVGPVDAAAVLTDSGVAATAAVTAELVVAGEPAVETPEGALGLAAAEEVTVTRSITALPGVAVPITGTGLITTGQALFAGALLTTTPLITPSVAATVEVEIELVVTSMMTSTVPATLTLRLSGMPTMSVPISFSLAAQTDALVSVVPIVEEEEAVPAPVVPTATVALTPAATLTPAVGLPEGLVFVNVTVPLTANVRSGPSTDTEVVRQIAPASQVQVVAQNAAGDWLLLADGNWIAVVVVDVAPTGLPVATDDLIALLRSLGTPPVPTPTPAADTIPVTPTLTATLPVTPVTPPGGTTFAATVTVNANLRGGPGTEFPIIGGTIAGQPITIVARNADGSWFLLDNGGWVSAGLVAGAPAVADVPLFEGGTDAAAPTPTPTPEPGGLVLPTPTPRPETSAAATPSVEENLYFIEADDAGEKFDQAINTVNRLINAAAGNTAIFSDTQWVTDMNTAIALMRSGGQDINALTPPARLAAAHAQMVAAATAYGQAADLLQSAVTAGNVTLLDQSLAQITAADATLQAGRTALAALR